MTSGMIFQLGSNISPIFETSGNSVIRSLHAHSRYLDRPTVTKLQNILCHFKLLRGVIKVAEA